MTYALSGSEMKPIVIGYSNRANVIRPYQAKGNAVKHFLLTILLTLCLAINAQAVGLQIHTAGTTVSAAAATLTENLGQVSGNALFGAGLYHFTGYQAVHSGTISSVDIGVQDDGNFQLIIMDAARNTLRSSTTVPVTVTTFGVHNVMTVTFPAVTINAGEYIGYYYSGMTYALTGAGQTYYRYGSPPPNLLATGYQMDILARINYAPPSYSVAASPGTNGTLDATTPSPVTLTSGATTSFKFNANSGYYVSAVSGCNGTIYSNSSSSVTTYTYTTGAITGACAVSATFQVISGGTEVLGVSTTDINHGQTNTYHFTGLTPVHNGSISSVDFNAASAGTFQLVIMNSSRNALRYGSTVSANSGLQTLTFPAVTINAGEYVGFYFTGNPNMQTTAGWVTYYGTSLPPSSSITGYKYSLLVRVAY